MSKRGDQEFLNDIDIAIKNILEYVKGMTFDDFIKDKKTQDAVVRNLEIIGEAVKNLSKAFIAKHKDIEWKQIAGMRDKVVHFYFGVNWDIVWNVVLNKLPELKGKIYYLLED